MTTRQEKYAQVEGAVKHSWEFGHLSEMAKRIATRIYIISISGDTGGGEAETKENMSWKKMKWMGLKGMVKNKRS